MLALFPFLSHTRSTLESVRRGIEFCSEVASAQNFLLNLTGCRVLHFTWNGDGNQEQVPDSQYITDDGAMLRLVLSLGAEGETYGWVLFERA